jgi:hypothetical protein
LADTTSKVKGFKNLAEYEHLVPNKAVIVDKKLWNWSTPLQTAIDELGEWGLLILPEYVLVTQTITTPRHFNFVSEKLFFGAGTNYNELMTQIVFDLPTGIAFELGINNTFNHIFVRNKATANTATCFNANSSPQFNRVGINNFDKGMKLTNGYYVGLNYVEWAYCNVALQVDYCYNLTLTRPVFRACKTAINGLTSIKPLTIHGGSIEGYSGAGAIIVPFSSHVSLHGTYFETRELNAGHIINLTGDGSTINVYGCQVYLNETTSFVNAGTRNNIVLNGKGNTFREESATTTGTPIAYILPANGEVDLSGDNWQAVTKGTYVGGALNAGAVSNFNIRPPRGTTGYQKEYMYFGRSLALPKLIVAPTTPIYGTVYHADGITWDPLNIGENKSYMVTYSQIGYEPLNGVVKPAKYTSLPAASSAKRGMIIRVEGAGGVADATYVCRKTVADNYEWKQLDN